MGGNDFLGALVGPQATQPTPAAPQPVEAGSNEVVVPAWPIPKIRHLSATSVSMFMRCPEQFRQRYILGLKERPGGAQVLGTGFHFAQESNFRQKIQSGEDISVEAVVEAFHHGWDTQLEKLGGVNEIAWDEREKPDTLRKKGADLAALYRTQVAPTLQPEAVEHGFLTKVEGVPVPFKGYIDFVGEREPNEGTPFTDPGWSSAPIVVDYKTAKAIKRELKPEWLLQARLYQMETGRRVEYHVAAKTKDPQIATPIDAPQLAIDPTEQALSTTTKLLGRVTKQLTMLYLEFGPDQAWPGAITHPWACNFCGYRKHCVWWQA